MNSALNVAREVKVDIGRFISVESEEGFKGYIVSVRVKLCSAHGTHLILKVKSRTDASVCNKFTVLALGAIIVRRQRVYLRYSRHRRYERRAYRASRSYEIPLTLTVPYKLLRYHIKNRKSVLYDRGKLPIKPCAYKLGQRVAVH